jgi:hypothetical protein
MSPETDVMRCSYRAPDDDFFCEKYQVWYPLKDCNVRVMHRTFEGCVGCFQGRVNLRRSSPFTGASAGGGTLLRFPRPDLPTLQPDRRPGALPPKR